MKILAAILILAVIPPAAMAQQSYAELAKRFEYGAATPALGVKEEAVQDRGGIKIGTCEQGAICGDFVGTLDDAGLAVGESRRIFGGSHCAGASGRRVADD
jgi:hypothetical protein